MELADRYRSTRVTEFRRAGLTFDVIDDGPLDGTPVLLLHGFPQRASSWDQVSPLLHARGLRTLAPDQRGYSPRARPTRRRDYRQDELIADVLTLIDELGVDQIDAVGHDWGAAIAWSLAGNHPDRVRTLTALSVPHPGAFLRAMPRGQLLKSWYMGFFQLPVVPEKLLSKGLVNPDFVTRAGLPAQHANRLATEIVEYGALTGALNWYRGMPLSDRHSIGRKVRVPTTYVWSDRDVALGRTGAELCAGWVDAPYEFITISGATHWLPETRPAEVAEAILDRVPTDS
ncbi:alpha/beta fold hydrolase [Gordonia sp. ABSL1-1]|uniref:alpha/beta fold hydrolase n=1 Tax=Gordonia sp. ABSL1-1 TaxID=3053923 RepID=UPI0025738E55|nr:alpha/beta fold hydrolase [Gordonia sp. ABSL1-1]MDL9935383.1 alpha/beta fold hydrolase [Gordonia sp. ABSL1-1]